MAITPAQTALLPEEATQLMDKFLEILVDNQVDSREEVTKVVQSFKDLLAKIKLQQATASEKIKFQAKLIADLQAENLKAHNEHEAVMKKAVVRIEGLMQSIKSLRNELNTQREQAFLRGQAAQKVHQDAIDSCNRNIQEMLKEMESVKAEMLLDQQEAVNRAALANQAHQTAFSAYSKQIEDSKQEMQALKVELKRLRELVNQKVASQKAPPKEIDLSELARQMGLLGNL